MSVPFHDLAAQHVALSTELNAAMARVLVSGRYALGPETERLEAALSDRVGTGGAVAVSSGTDALLAALMTLGVGPGDRVLTTPYSFVASATAIRRLGAIPVFVDIEPDSFNIDPRAAQEWLDQHRFAARTVKAIIAVHLFGQCADLDALRSVADDHRVALIEDFAQALDASVPYAESMSSAAPTFSAETTPAPRRAGSVGDLACLSFYPTKNLGAAGEAGMVFALDPDQLHRLRQLRNQGAEAPGVHRWLGGNFRMDELQAALLFTKLEHLTRWTERRRALAARYDKALAETPGVTTPPAVWGPVHHVYHQYVVRSERRDRIRKGLAGRGIETRVYYPLALHHQPCLSDLQLPLDAFAHARTAATQSLALPIHPFLTNEAQDRVIEALLEEVAR